MYNAIITISAVTTESTQLKVVTDVINGADSASLFRFTQMFKNASSLNDFLIKRKDVLLEAKQAVHDDIGYCCIMIKTKDEGTFKRAYVCNKNIIQFNEDRVDIITTINRTYEAEAYKARLRNIAERAVDDEVDTLGAVFRKVQTHTARAIKDKIKAKFNIGIKYLTALNMTAATYNYPDHYTLMDSLKGMSNNDIIEHLLHVETKIIYVEQRMTYFLLHNKVYSDETVNDIVTGAIMPLNHNQLKEILCWVVEAKSNAAQLYQKALKMGVID